jgi:hypothetical protein
VPVAGFFQDVVLGRGNIGTREEFIKTNKH